MNSLEVRTLSDRLVDIVRDRILDGSLPSDMPMRQDHLAAELGVSKIPLREALARLEQEGLLRSRPNRGYVVRELDFTEAEEVYALRLSLEPHAVAEAARLASPAEQDIARSTFAAMENGSGRPSGFSGAQHRAFHLALIRPAAQPITTQFLERLLQLADRYVQKHLEATGRSERANAEHAALLGAWLSRDADTVSEHLRLHLTQTRDDLRRQLQHRKTPVR